MNTEKESTQKPGFDKKALLSSYMKSNYRILGKLKHSAIKPCHWQEQKLLTGRDNRNCYKGYFGIESHLCIQNTPALPFCNHQCIFCWRDIESASFGAKWKGGFDSPKILANEMIRHSLNLIFEHISLDKSLINLELMHKILTLFIEPSNSTESLQYNELALAEKLKTTRARIHRAVLVLKNTKILINIVDDVYVLQDHIKPTLQTQADVEKLIASQVTTKEEIEKAFEEAKHPKHAAISLAGEPTLYPKIGELVSEFRKRGMSTFIVTNGTHPEVLRKLKDDNQLPTQLYVTLPAPNKKEYLKVCRPLERDSWERILETLKLLPTLPTRTVVRITSVKYINMNLDMVPDYVKLLKMGTPHFIDIKGFTIEAHALKMQKRFGGERDLREYGPKYEDIYFFAKALEEQGGFEIIETHEASKDILLRGAWPKDKSIKIDYSLV
jgi:tRNA wybutosine-synthesizing protein 1